MKDLIECIKESLLDVDDLVDRSESDVRTNLWFNELIGCKNRNDFYNWILDLKKELDSNPSKYNTQQILNKSSYDKKHYFIGLAVYRKSMDNDMYNIKGGIGDESYNGFYIKRPNSKETYFVVYVGTGDINVFKMSESFKSILSAYYKHMVYVIDDPSIQNLCEKIITDRRNV